MGLTERHWFEDEEPELTENQLEDILWENNKAFERGYQKGFLDGQSAILRKQEAVEPTKVEMGNRTDYFCRNCATKVGMLFSNEDVWRFHYNSCPYCGRKVKWE